jgi:hypothetical protein
MKLIKIENYSLQIADEALLIKPIRKLYNQDRSASKEQFYKQMSYLYFMVDPRSTYSYILNEEDRAKEIIAQEGLDKDFKPSPLLQEAMEVYKKHTVTPSQELLNAALTAAHTVSNFLKKPDILEDVDDKGKPKYQISSITAALKNVEGIVSSLQNLQKKVESELTEQSKARGSQELTIFDEVD